MFNLGLKEGDWESKMIKFFTMHRNVSNDLLDFAMDLEFALRMKERLHMVKKFLHVLFRIYPFNIDDDDILNRIARRSENHLDE